MSANADIILTDDHIILSNHHEMLLIIEVITKINSVGWIPGFVKYSGSSLRLRSFHKSCRNTGKFTFSQESLRPSMYQESLNPI